MPLGVRRLLRMGSAASSNIKTINIDQNSEKYDRPRSSKEGKEKKELIRDVQFKDLQDDFDQCRKELMTTQGDLKQSEKEIKQLEYLLSEAESTNLDQADRIQVLEDEIVSINQRHLLSASVGDYSETLKVKDQYIDKLERRTEAVEKEICKLKNQHKKKLRLVRNQLAESQQEKTLKVFELKDEMNKMAEDKTRLLERLERAKSAPSGSHKRSKCDDLDPVNDENFERTHLILELSQQVSQQDDRIHKLEQKLKEKDVIIEKLSERLKGSQSRSSPRQHEDQSKSSLKPNKDLTELQELAKDMKKLSTKKRTAKKDGMRRSSGISRDSGIVAMDHGIGPTGSSTSLLSANSSLCSDQERIDIAGKPPFQTKSRLKCSPSYQPSHRITNDEVDQLINDSLYLENSLKDRHSEQVLVT